MVNSRMSKTTPVTDADNLLPSLPEPNFTPAGLQDRSGGPEGRVTPEQAIVRPGWLFSLTLTLLFVKEFDASWTAHQPNRHRPR